VFKYIGVSAITGLFVIMAISPCVISEDIPYIYYNPFHDTPNLYFQCNQTWGNEKYIEDNHIFYYPVPTGYEPSLIFGRDNSHPSSFIDYGYATGWNNIYAEENLTLSIKGIKGRVYNPDIELEAHIFPYYKHWLLSNYSGNFSLQLRSDGDGDGVFEYIVDFPKTNTNFDMKLIPSYITGVPMDFTNGTIEIEIQLFGNSTKNFSIYGGPDVGSWIQVPFDKDTDSDGIGDFSDLD
jgi:hypothetical protein